MILEALGLAALVALASVLGVFFYGQDKRLVGIEKYIVPVAVGVFLSLVLNELIPEVTEASPQWGGTIIMIGFLSFYVLAHKLHKKYHNSEFDDCDRKGAAALVLIGDGVHILLMGLCSVEHF
ncbi:MAG: hypothetical protein LR008_03180 [Candidatus Pacebacteria bacterium]|nr:hypothetical protein [Candidatus Paceibacterota bacterium]